MIQAIVIGAAVVVAVLGLPSIPALLWLNRPGSIALIGRQSAGETTFLDFLAHQKLSMRTSPTTAWTGPKQVKVGKRTLRIYDVAGDRLDQWVRATKRPENILYFFDASLVYREDVKLHLCGSPRAKDANIRQALIDRWGGKAEAVGTVKKPGPLYGVKSHAWSALAVAVTALETRP